MLARHVNDTMASSTPLLPSPGCPWVSEPVCSPEWPPLSAASGYPLAFASGSVAPQRNAGLLATDC